MELSSINKKYKLGIIWLCIAHFACDIYGGFLNPILPYIASNLNFSMSTATILVAITQICSNILQPIFGFFADNILKRFFIFWGLILASVFIPLAPSAPNIYLLTFFMILGCLGGSFFHPQSMGFVNTFSGESKAKNMGIFVSLGSLGFAFGPLLAAFITQIAGLNKVFYTSIFGLILAFWMFTCVPKISNLNIKSKQIDFFKSFKDIFINKEMNYLMIISMMKSLVTNSSCILLPFLWKSLDYSAFYIGIALFLFVSAGAIGSFLSPHLEHYLGAKRILYISMIGTFPLMIVFSMIYKNYPIISLFLFALMGFNTMLAQPITLIWAQKILPKYKSIIAGLINGFCWGTVALILSFLGFIAEKYGIINVLVVLTLLPVFCSYFIAKLKEYNC